MTTPTTQTNRQKTDWAFDDLYHDIRERICVLDFEPGTSLREEALAQEYGVSRTPIRRALHRLEFEGLVTINKRAGAVVTTVDLRSLREIYAFRLKLLEFIGELSTRRLSSENIAFLKGLLDQCKGMHDRYDPQQLSRLYNEFHEEMLKVIGNRTLRQISDQLFHQTSRVWLQILPDLDWEQEVDIICEEIADVIDALEEGNMHKVAQIRRHHLSWLLRRTNNYLSSADVG